MLRAAQSLVVILAALVPAFGCKTVTDPLPPQATLNVDVTDSMLGTQRAPMPAPQVVIWKVDAMSISNVPGVDGSYSFLYSGPCAYQLNVASLIPFSNACRSSGLTLRPGTLITGASVTVTISKLELRTALRPDLSPGGDPDGDGVPTATDVCPIVSNLNAADFAACQAGPDQDLDGVPDSIDNCLWYPSPPAPGQIVPTDADQDGIGDICERIAPVVLPPAGLSLQCDDVTLTAQGSAISLLRMDFGQPGVLTCDAGFTGCTIDPSAVRLGLVGTATTFVCHAVP